MTANSSALIRVRVYGPLEVSRCLSDGTWHMIERSEWGPGTPQRNVFKRLLTAPGRRLVRADLQDDLWPEMSMELADHHLSNALTIIRRVIGRELVETSGPLCALADQPLLWVDLTACTQLLKEAENQGCTTPAALPLLEEACAYVERGACLADESATWCHAVRADAERMARQCRLWLAEGYERQGKLWQAGEQYRALTQTLPPDEEALQRWLEMLVRYGKRQEAVKCYQSVKALWEARGFKVSPELEQAITTLEKSLTLALTIPVQPFGNNLLFKRSGGEQSLNYSRRQILQGILATACTTLTLSPYKFLQPEREERLLASVNNSLYFNDAVLEDFSEITQRYWKLSANASRQLLNGLLGLFQDITQILSTVQTPASTERLYALASEVAQLIGKTLFDLRDYSLASSYYGFALKAALEAHNYDLWAASLGRMGLLLLSNEQPQKALLLLEEAQAIPIQSSKICSWHAAIKAEACSLLGDASSCQKFLGRAKDTSEATFLESDPYATSFSKARLASYEGVCYLRLQQPEHALPVFEQAMKLIDPSAIRQLARLLTYLADTHIQLGYEQQAYTCIQQALSLTYQTHSLDILSHIRRLRDNIVIGGNSKYIKDLDNEIESVYITITHGGEFHG